MHLNSLESAYVHFCRDECFVSHRRSFFVSKHDVFVYMGDRLYDSNAFCIFPKKTGMSDFVYFLMHVFLLIPSFCPVGSCVSVESCLKNIVKRKLILN